MDVNLWHLEVDSMLWTTSCCLILPTHTWQGFPSQQHLSKKNFNHSKSHEIWWFAAAVPTQDCNISSHFVSDFQGEIISPIWSKFIWSCLGPRKASHKIYPSAAIILKSSLTKLNDRPLVLRNYPLKLFMQPVYQIGAFRGSCLKLQPTRDTCSTHFPG